MYAIRSYYAESGFLIRLFQKLEDTCLKSADGIITICPDLANYVNSLLKDRSRHFMIENSIFDPVRLCKAMASAPSPDNAVPAELPKNKKLVVYAGIV